MDEKFILTEFSIIDVLDEIRKPNGNKQKSNKTFAHIVPDVWNKLGLAGKPDQVLLEQLLINLILAMYDEQDVQSDKEKRDRAKQRDFSLLMFGLLDGYYHTEEKNGKKVNVPPEERYERYLNDGYFIGLDYPGEGTYQEIKAVGKVTRPGRQNRPLNALTRAISDCKKKIGEELFRIIQDKSYNQYMGELQCMDNAETPINLPKPYYIPENFQPQNINPKSDAADKGDENRWAGGKAGEASKDSRERMPRKWIWQLIISGAAGGIIACCFFSFVIPFIHSLNMTEKGTPIVAEIYVFNNKFFLPVGEKETLSIAVSPAGADKNSVKCIVSKSPELVQIENDYDIRAQSKDEWQDEAEHTATVLVQGGSAEAFPVEVTVINPWVYEDKAKDNLPNSEY